MSILEEGLAAEFIAAGYKEFSDGTRMPAPQEYANLRKLFYTEVEGKSYRSYAIEIRIFDMHRLNTYPQVCTDLPRWIFEAHIHFYGNGMEGVEEILPTNVSYVVKDVEQTERHAVRLWYAMGQTTE